MSRQLYFECASGISGDMTVAALLDLGASQEVLLRTLKTLPIEEPYEIRISRVKKSSLDACDFLVELPGNEDFKDHDMEYLHGHDHGHGHTHDHHHHHGRGPEEIRAIFAASEMTDGAKEIAGRILDILAEAEAAVHGMDKSQVHFHEAGATDSIIDIAAAAICLDDLRPEGVIVTELCEGRGNVRCQHGLLPIPVPAVTKIAAAHGLTFRFLPVDGELVTPTGAAIAAAAATSHELPASVKILGCGLGAGKRAYDAPEVLRIFLVEAEEDGLRRELKKDVARQDPREDVIWKLETNIDDCSGELLGFVMDRLFAAGARDVSYTPVFMKKNRPAYEIHVICTEDKIGELEEILFAETTTIGIRRARMERTVLPREIREVDTSLGRARVKICRLRDGVKIYPEYESMAALAKEHRLPLEQIYETIKGELRDIDNITG